jgi:hypothetical protein
MFMLRNLGKLVFGDMSKQDIIQLDQGQLYIVRPHSVKGYSECMYANLLSQTTRISC